MSKSAADPSSCILLTDSHETIVKRIRGTVTDLISGITFDPAGRPGTSNLLTILSACTGEVPAALAERYTGSNHGSLKRDVAEAVEEVMRKPRAEFARLCGDRTFLAQVARDGAEKAREHSDEMMREAEVRRQIGLSRQLYAYCMGCGRSVLIWCRISTRRRYGPVHMQPAIDDRQRVHNLEIAV